MLARREHTNARRRPVRGREIEHIASIYSAALARLQRVWRRLRCLGSSYSAIAPVTLFANHHHPAHGISAPPSGADAR